MPPSDFQKAVGSSSWLFLVLAALAWLLLPLGHPVYMAVVAPYLILGAVLALRLLRHPPARPSSISPWTEPECSPKWARWTRLGLWLISSAAAFMVPSPWGSEFSSPGKTFIWAVLGARWAAAILGGVLLALYAWAIHVLLEAAVSAIAARRKQEASH
jgi:hypothetical protein